MSRQKAPRILSALLCLILLFAATPAQALYPTLRDHARAWIVVMAVINAATCTALYLLLRRFTTEAVSGAVVLVPLFLNEGDVIKVDTRDGTYIERV